MVGKMVIRKYAFHGRGNNVLGTTHCLNVLISCLLWFVPADNFTAVFHSLDVWHKAKSIRNCLAKVKK